jgi:hypothetical protein
MSTRGWKDGSVWAGRWRSWAAPAACAAAVLCAASAHADVRVGRSWAARPPLIDGTVAAGEWNDAQVTTLAHGRMATMNDGRHLYVLLDVTDDTVDDPLGSSRELFTLAFDVDLNRAVTPGVDLAYATCGSARPFVKTHYLGLYTFDGCRTVSAGSAGAIGFGTTPASPTTAHRVWEFQLEFAEIGVVPAAWTTLPDAPHVRVNVGLGSQTPSFLQGEPQPDVFPADLSLVFRVDLAIAPVFPPGSTGLTFAGVGFVPANLIDSSGYATVNVPGYSYGVTDAPFGGGLNVFGNWADLYAQGARTYRVLHAAPGAPPAPLLETWTNFRHTGATWSPRAIGPDAAGRYTVPPPGEAWYLPNLLVTFRTNGLADGTYTLSLELFDATGAPLPAPADNSLMLRVINTRPEANLHHILYGGVPIPACSIVWSGPTPSDFTFEITAADGNGALGGWSLGAVYGDNQRAHIAGDDYAANVGADGDNRWNGIRTTLLPTTWRAPVQCAYALTVSAWSRSQNGYGPAVPGASYTKTFTYLAGTGPRDCK